MQAGPASRDHIVTRLSGRARAIASRGFGQRVEVDWHMQDCVSATNSEPARRGEDLFPSSPYVHQHQQVNHERERTGPASLDAIRWSATRSER